MLDSDLFQPHGLFRNPMLQTFLNSSGLRKLGRKAYAMVSEELLLDAGNGVRLQGFLSRSGDGTEKGIAILLHGWEGSADSAYIVHMGHVLIKNGYDVFRLNLRDHGETHHLNRGPFLGTLIEEAVEAVRVISKMAGDTRLFIIGFSMGANFALRMARIFSDAPVNKLARVVCINPPLDPMKATESIDMIGMIRSYFMKKWKGSLSRKQELFPDQYSLDDILSMDTCMDMTEALIERYTDYKDARDYFSRYNLTSGWLDKIRVPTLVISSEDDPVIPAGDFHKTRMSREVNLVMNRYGGHCGYISGLTLRSWYHGRIVRLFDGKSA